MRCRLLLSFLLSLPLFNVSGQEPVAPQITADVFEAEFATGAAVYRGNATARYGDVVVKADELRYNVRERIIEARGHVVLTRGDTRLLAAELSYQLDSRTYRVRDLRFGQLPVYVSGSLVEGDRQLLQFTDARVTYGEPGRFAPTFSADTVTFDPARDRVRAEGARVGLGLWQPLPLPATEIPTNIPFLSYLSLDGGYNSFLGAYADIGVQVPVGGGFSLGGNLGGYTQRGVLLGPAASYRVNEGTDQEMIGAFNSGYVHDNGERLTDLRGKPVPKDRGFVTWSHRQRFGERLSLAALVNYWSDSEVLRDFRP